jgi:hypothetical protein
MVVCLDLLFKGPAAVVEQASAPRVARVGQKGSVGSSPLVYVRELAEQAALA